MRTATALADLMAFANGGRPARMRPMLHALGTDDVERQRRRAQRELDWINTQWRSVLAPLKRERARAQRGQGTEPRGGARQAGWVAHWPVTIKVHHRTWERMARKGKPGALSTFIEAGLTDLLSPAPAGMVLTCALPTCGQFFLQPLEKRTRICCCDAHATTLRSLRARGGVPTNKR